MGKPLNHFTLWAITFLAIALSMLGSLVFASLYAGGFLNLTISVQFFLVASVALHMAISWLTPVALEDDDPFQRSKYFAGQAHAHSAIALGFAATSLIAAFVEDPSMFARQTPLPSLEAAGSFETWLRAAGSNPSVLTILAAVGLTMVIANYLLVTFVARESRELRDQEDECERDLSTRDVRASVWAFFGLSLLLFSVHLYLQTSTLGVDLLGDHETIDAPIGLFVLSAAGLGLLPSFIRAIFLNSAELKEATSLLALLRLLLERFVGLLLELVGSLLNALLLLVGRGVLIILVGTLAASATQILPLSDAFAFMRFVLIAVAALTLILAELVTALVRSIDYEIVGWTIVGIVGFRLFVFALTITPWIIGVIGRWIERKWYRFWEKLWAKIATAADWFAEFARIRYHRARHQHSKAEASQSSLGRLSAALVGGRTDDEPATAPVIQRTRRRLGGRA